LDHLGSQLLEVGAEMVARALQFALTDAVIVQALFVAAPALMVYPCVLAMLGRFNKSDGWFITLAKRTTKIISF